MGRQLGIGLTGRHPEGGAATAAPLAYTEAGPRLPRRRPAGRAQTGHGKVRKLENAMAVIVIKDLTENVDLDREAMTAITGGTRTAGGHHWQAHRRTLARLIQYPQGFPGRPEGSGQVAGQERVTGKLPRK
ncbi:hypothetical protein [Cupriavidus campinensis]